MGTAVYSYFDFIKGFQSDHLQDLFWIFAVNVFVPYHGFPIFVSKGYCRKALLRLINDRSQVRVLLLLLLTNRGDIAQLDRAVVKTISLFVFVPFYFCSQFDAGTVVYGYFEI